MTPHSQPAETVTRPRRPWPPIAWKVVALAAVAMALAVSLTAWIAAGECRHHRAAEVHR